MAGPWEKYQEQKAPEASAGPWEKFAESQQEAPQEESETSLSGIIGDKFVDFDRPRRALKAAGQIAVDQLAGVGKGASDVGLGLQHYLGKGIKAVGGDSVGDWLVNDAAAGREKIKAEFAPHQERSPIASKISEVGGQVLMTAPVGRVLAAPVAPIAPRLASSLSTSGFVTGSNLGKGAPVLKQAADMGIRMAGGAATGGVSAGLIDPENAKSGAIIGGLLPPAAKAAGFVGGAIRDGLDSASKKLMNSALKPTIEMHRKGEAAKAVQTMLDEGLNATKGGVEKLNTLIDDINDAVKKAVGSSTATVDKKKVLSALDDTKNAFIKDVSPASALNQIDEVGKGFATHPLIPNDQIPVQLAQDLKVGTYRNLKKSYGEMKGAETEARKALARGLKEEIALAVPEVSALNAREGGLLNALKVAERRVLMDANKNPIGLGAIAPNKAAFLAFLADRNAALKSIAARGAYQASQPRIGLLASPELQQLGYQSTPVITSR